MKYIVVAIRDRAADVFGQPFCINAIGQAIRSFHDEVNRVDEKNQLYMHPEDFDLYELGTYDDSEGRFDSLVPRQVAIGKDVKVRS